jgi:hypothetical protein
MAASVQELLLAAQAKQKKRPLSMLADLIDSGVAGYTKGVALGKVRSETDKNRAEIAQTLVATQMAQEAAARQQAAQESMRKQMQEQYGIQSEVSLRKTLATAVPPPPAPTTPVNKITREFNTDEKGNISSTVKIVPVEPPAAPDRNKMTDNENALRTQYLSQSKDFADTATSYQRIIDSSKNPSAAGDLSLIYNYMKMLDPGSTVREGEFATAQNAGSLSQSLIGQYNKILSGERLAPELRNDFINRAGKLYSGQKERHAQRVSEFQGIAIRSGLDPKNITINLETPIKGFGDKSAAKPRQINSQAEYDALPSGTEYIDSEGNNARKK